MVAARLDPSGKPYVRGALHQWAFVVSLVVGVRVVLEAGSVRARLAVEVYAVGVRIVRRECAVSPR